VLEAADAGDKVAGEIVDGAARTLAATAVVVVRKLGLASEVPLALAGGVFVASTSYRQRVLQALASLGVHPSPVTLVEEPAEGAVRLALPKGHTP
jgi:N-acetylglucosamine kinase-like BadF-type ATPase